MLEAIQGLVEMTDHVRMCGVDKARRLSAIDCLLKRAMEKCVLDVQLMNRPVAGDRKAENSVDGSRLDDGAESFVEVDAGTLGKAAKHPAGLVPVEGAVGLELVLEEPLAGDDVGATWTRNKIPGAVGEEG